MITKICFKCGEDKPLYQFYRHPQMKDGHVNKCKECNKKDVQENYRATIADRKKYERTRLHDPKRIAAREEYRVKNPAAFVKSNKAYHNRNPEKYLAHCAVSNAIRDKRLFRGPCAVCGELKVEAHHTDYNKPLDVIWLCKRHHLHEHGKVMIADLDL